MTATAKYSPERLGTLLLPYPPTHASGTPQQYQDKSKRDPCASQTLLSMPPKRPISVTNWDDRPVGRASAVAIGAQETRTRNIQQLLQGACATGVLKLANRQLAAVPPELTSSLHDAVSYSDKKWWEEVDLTSLDISHNNITMLPVALFNTGGGSRVSTSANSSSQAAVGNTEAHCGDGGDGEGTTMLPSLKSLLASHNSLTTLPPMRYLSSLTKLDCSFNKLSGMLDLRDHSSGTGAPVVQDRSSQPGRVVLPPGHRGQLAPGAAPMLARHSGTDGPDAAAKGLIIMQMKELNVAGNRLSSIVGLTPQWLADVAVVDVSGNELNSIDDRDEVETETSSTMSLRILNASSNQLTRFPFRLLQKTPLLQTLDLSRNRIEWSSPGSCGGGTFRGDVEGASRVGDQLTLPALTILNLRQNKLQDLPKLCMCTQLAELHLGHNDITVVSAAWFDGCRETLKFIDLSNNKINQVDALTVLVKLQRCDLSNNDLSTLPPRMGLLKDLSAIVLDGNPMKGIRREIVLKGTKELLAYLKSRLTETDVLSLQRGESLPSQQQPVPQVITGGGAGTPYPSVKGTTAPSDVATAQQRRLLAKYDTDGVVNMTAHGGVSLSALVGSALSAPNGGGGGSADALVATLIGEAKRRRLQQDEEDSCRRAQTSEADKASRFTTTNAAAFRTAEPQRQPAPPSLQRGDARSEATSVIGAGAFLGQREGDLWDLSFATTAGGGGGGRGAGAGGRSRFQEADAAIGKGGSVIPLPAELTEDIYVLAPPNLGLTSQGGVNNRSSSAAAFFDDATTKNHRLARVRLSHHASLRTIHPSFLAPLAEAGVVDIDVSHTGLTSIDAFLCAEMTSLRCLNLSHCQLQGPMIPNSPFFQTIVPQEGLPLLANLHHLNLSFNNRVPMMMPSRSDVAAVSPSAPLSGLSTCFCHENFPALTHINLSGNRFVHFPDSILRLPTLTEVLLAENGLLEVPDAVTLSWPRLQTFDLQNNDLTNVPPRLGLLSLRSLLLTGNRIKWLRQSVLDKGTPAVLQFLRDRIVSS